MVEEEELDPEEALEPEDELAPEGELDPEEPVEVVAGAGVDALFPLSELVEGVLLSVFDSAFLVSTG